MEGIKKIKGTTDFLPQEQRIRNYIAQSLTNIFENYGYQPIETPILCYYDVLALKYDEDNDILKEIYQLRDQGDRKLGLRYDLTVPFAKYLALNKGINLPFKKYEIGKAFRDGPVKVGRNREFIQCDVDVVGITSMMIEAELISLFVEAFNKLKIDIEIKYNNRKLLSGIILESNISDDKTGEVITIIDKIEKYSRDDIIKQLMLLNINSDSIDKLFMYLDLDLIKLKEIANNDILIKGIEELEELNRYLVKLNLSSYVKLVPSLARGQEYYTGTVFEVFAKNTSINSSIASGGRYDNMITDFINDGNSYPAIGISFGLNVIYEILKDKQELNENNIDLYIIPLGIKEDSLLLANKLRNKNIKVILEMNDRKVKKALDWANRNNIPNVIILGENEIENNVIEIKKMLTSVSYQVNINEIDKMIEIIREK